MSQFLTRSEHAHVSASRSAHDTVHCTKITTFASKSFASPHPNPSLFASPRPNPPLFASQDEDLPFSKATDAFAYGTIWCELITHELPYKRLLPEIHIWQGGNGTLSMPEGENNYCHCRCPMVLFIAVAVAVVMNLV